MAKTKTRAEVKTTPAPQAESVGLDLFGGLDEIGRTLLGVSEQVFDPKDEEEVTDDATQKVEPGRPSEERGGSGSAFSPFPGITINVGGGKRSVASATAPASKKAPGEEGDSK